MNRKPDMLMLVALFHSCIGWQGAPVASAAAAPAVDLMPRLARAEVCPADEEGCLSWQASEDLHRGGESAPGTIRLPSRANTNLYLRLPANTAFRLELSYAGGTLRVGAETDGTAEQEVYRSSPEQAPSSWRPATVDLARFAGQIVRLAFRAEPTPGGDSDVTGIRVRRAELLGNQPTPLSLPAPNSRPAWARRP
jgi:hypothetical protein